MNIKLFFRLLGWLLLDIVTLFWGFSQSVAWNAYSAHRNETKAIRAAQRIFQILGGSKK